MKILVSALDWGLGHATRLSALIRPWVERGDQVVLAGSGSSLMLLQADYPNLHAIPLKSFSPKYSRYLPAWLMIAIQSPILLIYIIRERRELDSILRANNFDLVVSDNRYGLFSKRTKCVFITHQLAPIVHRRAPQFINNLFARLLQTWICRFDEVWIPDDEKNLSGILSKTKLSRPPIRMIGRLSRLKRVQPCKEYQSDHLAIISGAEPQRTVFEQQVIKLFERKGGHCIIIRGLIGQAQCPDDRPNIHFVNFANADELSYYIASASEIYCRSGYSTIMDLAQVGKKAHLIPTPGQPEQEYLQYLHQNMSQF